MLDGLRALGAALSRFTERWVPDAWVICLMLTAVALALAIGFAGVGVEAGRATSAEEFNDHFARGIAAPGPYVIEAVI